MLFFELLQVALQTRDKLGRIPTDREWEEIYNVSEQQSVTGILLYGIERLPEEQRPSKAILIHWIGIGQIIERRNRLMDKRCVELLEKLNNYGLRGTILKGQGIARLYDEELKSLRQSGDIDIYVNCGQKKAFSFAHSLGQEKIEWDYKHLHMNVWDDTEVEMHYRVEVFLNLWKNRILQKWFKGNKALLFSHDCGFTTPTIEFNVFYILLHIYRHFLYEGVGFRQIVDYYFVLKTKANAEGTLVTDYARETVSQFGMEKFAKGLMWVMRATMGMPKEWMPWEPDEKEGRYILEQVMIGGNFGQHDKRLKHPVGKLWAVKAILKHNLHLLTHYPSDVIWAPVWIVWHKLWKLTRVRLLQKRYWMS